MTGEEFELYLDALFAKNGYKVETTKKSRDFGCDLVLKREGVVTVVQAKRYQNKVGISAIQEVLGAKEYYRADIMMVVTNSFFSRPAQELAEKSGIILWDRSNIERKIEELT